MNRGYKVKFIKRLNNYPYCNIKEGDTGFLMSRQDGFSSIKLDKHHKGLNNWNNELIISEKGESLFDEMDSYIVEDD